MHTSELLFRHLKRRLFSEDYIDWATAMLGERSDLDSLWELAGLSLYAIINPYEVGEHFQRCAADLGLDTRDPQQALNGYVRHVCTSMVGGGMDIAEGIGRLYEFFDDDEIYLFGIWHQLIGDLARLEGDLGQCSPIAHRFTGDRRGPVLDTELATMHADDFARLVAAQFIKLIGHPLPDTFPFVLICAACGTMPLAFPAPASGIRCPECACPVSEGAPRPCLDMRRYRHREYFLLAAGEKHQAAAGPSPEARPPR